VTWETIKDAPLAKAVPISESDAQKIKFKFAPPEDVLVLGSYLLRTVAKPVLNIDVGVELPKALHLQSLLVIVCAEGWQLIIASPHAPTTYRVSSVKRRTCSTTVTGISAPLTFICWPRSCRRTSASPRSSGPDSGEFMCSSSLGGMLLNPC
jgi:hypothetical protein